MDLRKSKLSIGDVLNIRVYEGDTFHKYTVVSYFSNIGTGGFVETKKGGAKSFLITDIFPHVVLCKDRAGDNVTFDVGDLRIAGYL